MLTGVEEFRMSDSSCVDPVALDKTLKHIYIKSNSLLNKIITVRAVRPDGPPSVCGNQKKKKKRFSSCYQCQTVDDGISYRVAHMFTGFVDQQIISHASNIRG